MEGVQGGSAQQFRSIQTQTDSASEVGKSHTRDSISQVEAQPTPGLTDPGNVKHISLKTRIVNFLNNKWTPISDGVKARVVGNVENPDEKAKVSNAINGHNNGVDKLKALKEEKQQLESEVKGLEKDKTFMKMVGIATTGRSFESDRKKGALVLIQGEDGKLTKNSFKHNDHVTNVKDLRVAVRSFRESKQFSEYTEKLVRIKDITQERAELKESLRDSGKQTASDLKSGAKQQHKNFKEALSDIKRSEIDYARDQFSKKFESIKTVYEELKSSIKDEKKNIDGELKELKKQRDEARSEVRGGLAAKWSNWHKKNIDALVSRLTPKGVTVNSDSIKGERISIKDGLDNSRNKVKKLDKEIDSKRKEKAEKKDIMNDARENRDDEIESAKNEKAYQIKGDKSDHEWDKLEEEVNYDMAKDANKDVAKALKGNAVKGNKKKM